MEIVSVQTAKDLRTFIDVPWHIYDPQEHPRWVPPLRVMVKDTLDRKKNPFYKNASYQAFVALRDGKPVGRIAAIENRAHNAYHGDRVGFWGFFESVDDQEVADALFASAEGWLTERGLTAMRGPMSPSTNQECGLLVDGYDEHPMIMTTWNPAYYHWLVTRAGLAGVKDLLGFYLPVGARGFTLPREFGKHAERAKKHANLSFRDLEPKHFWKEVEVCWDVYNSAWENNWGFVPMTHDEFVHMAKDLKPLLVPRFAFIAEVDGKPAGFMLAIPDANELFKKIPNGRLLPSGIFKLLLGKSKVKSCRILTLGLKEEFRKRSILQLFTHEAVRRAHEWGAIGGEASWILEDNVQMAGPIRRMGGREYRRWRIYEKPLAGSA